MNEGAEKTVVKYERKKMMNLMDNLRHNIFPEITQYLTGSDLTKGERFLKLETLLKFRVGVGEETFYDESKEEWVRLPSVYFPMYAPLS
jgi:hypothetical protein